MIYSILLIVIILHSSAAFYDVPPEELIEEIRHSNGVLTVKALGQFGNQLWEYLSLLLVWRYDYWLYKAYKIVPVIEDDMKAMLGEVFDKISIPSLPGAYISNLTENFTVLTLTDKNAQTNLHCNLDMKQKKKHEKLKIELVDYAARYPFIINNGLLYSKYAPVFKPQLVYHVKQLFKDLADQYMLPFGLTTFVCMHYRGGDYIDYMGRMYGQVYTSYYIPDYRYYVDAMNSIKHGFANIIYILVTTDEEWLAKNLAPIVTNGRVEVNPFKYNRSLDFTLLAHCNFNIINYGKFGSAASLMGKQNTIIYYMQDELRFFGPVVAMGIRRYIYEKWCVGNETYMDILCIKKALLRPPDLNAI